MDLLDAWLAEMTAAGRRIEFWSNADGRWSARLYQGEAPSVWSEGATTLQESALLLRLAWVRRVRRDAA